MAVGLPALSDDECRAVDAVDERGLVEAVRELVRIPSWLGLESPAQELVASLIDQADLTLDTWDIDLPAVQSHDACSWEIERGEARGVVGTLPGRGTGRTLLLNGHVDVVPPGNEALWNHPPFGGVLHEGRVYGRGALDMKGPLIAGLFAVKALKDAAVDLAGTVHLLSVIGEEDGGIGTLATILRGYHGDGAIVMEPTNLTIAPAQAGCLNFRVRVRGRAAHGAVRREGVSAFEKLFDVHQVILELEADRNEPTSIEALFSRNPLPFPISIGIMEGGDWASSVPDHAMMAGRLGVRPDEDVAEARSQFEDAVATAASRDPFLREQPPQVEWWGGRFMSASTPVDHPLVQDLHSAVTSVTGKEPSLEGVPFGADAGLLQRVADTPAILFGAGDIRDAHRPNESVAVADLVTMARSLAVAAIRFCGEEGP